MAATVPSYTLPNVYVRRDPVSRVVPLFLNSPHSGRSYPPDFDYAVPLELVRAAEDGYVDELIADAPQHGITTLACQFPRAYLDANRSAVDIDPEVLAEPWPGEVQSSYRGSNVGIGLVWRVVDRGVPLYDRKLTVAEVQHRIGTYHAPYHEALHGCLQRLKRRFGTVWFVDCHSMASHDRFGDPPWRGGTPFPDFVVSDREGTTCEPDFTALAVSLIREAGYTYTVNDPFKGGYITQFYGDPAQGVHGLQIEINRNLYMNPATHEKLAGFDRFQRFVTHLVARLGAHARGRVAY